MPRSRDPSGLEASAKARKRPPFGFVLDALAPLGPSTRSMFGCTAVYLGEKIVLALRDKGDADSGVWIATDRAHHPALRDELPSLRRIEVFGPGESHWRMLPADHPRFEDDALRVCALLRAGDPRIGRVPAPRKRPAASQRPPRAAPRTR